MNFSIVGGRVVTPNTILDGAAVNVRNGQIESVGDPSPRAETIDAAGQYVMPGLFDLHGHGRLIFFDATKTSELLREDARGLIATGVTRFLPTLASAPLEEWLKELPVIRVAINQPGPGAIPMGVHLEGVFFNAAAGGAHPPNLLRAYDRADPLQERLFDEFADIVRIVAFAPEVAGNEGLIELCGRKKFTAALGHSAATADQARSYADRGVRHMTHLFNGMKGVHHRDPGPALAGLVDDRVAVELICDGHHLHPDIIRLIHRAKPRNKRILITDSVIVNLPGIVSGGPDEPNRLPNGTLAGSRLRLCSAVRNYIRFTGCDLAEAVAMASLNPAVAAGLDENCGSIEPGKFADLCLAGEDLVPAAVWVAGRREL